MKKLGLLIITAIYLTAFPTQAKAKDSISMTYTQVASNSLIK